SCRKASGAWSAAARAAALSLAAGRRRCRRLALARAAGGTLTLAGAAACRLALAAAEAAARSLPRRAAGQVPRQTVQTGLRRSVHLCHDRAVDIEHPQGNLVSFLRQGVIDDGPRWRVFAGKAAIGPATSRRRLPAIGRHRLEHLWRSDVR